MIVAIMALNTSPISGVKPDTPPGGAVGGEGVPVGPVVVLPS